MPCTKKEVEDAWVGRDTLPEGFADWLARDLDKLNKSTPPEILQLMISQVLPLWRAKVTHDA